MHYIVEEIEFDFEDSQGTIDKEEQQFITENAIGLWYVDSEYGDPEDELIEITPLNLRIRKMELDINKRISQNKKNKDS